MYFMQKQEDKLTFKSSLNEQKYFFITFDMKKMTPVFHSNYFFFLSKINLVYTYITKRRMFIEKCKTSFDNSNIM